MDTLFIKSLNNNGNYVDDAYITATGEGVLVYCPENETTQYPLTTKQANQILKDAGYEIGDFDWSVIDNYKSKSQQFYDIFRYLPSQILEFCYISHDIGFNPAFYVSSLADNRADVYFSEDETKFPCFKEEDNNKPYVVFKYNFSNGQLTNIVIYINHYKYKKSIGINMACPNCGALVQTTDDFGQVNDHCPSCGFLLDWET